VVGKTVAITKLTISYLALTESKGRYFAVLPQIPVIFGNAAMFYKKSYRVWVSAFFSPFN
jgi:hypothetical protein